jgi:hypothetical protein
MLSRIFPSEFFSPHPLLSEPGVIPAVLPGKGSSMNASRPLTGARCRTPVNPSRNDAKKNSKQKGPHMTTERKDVYTRITSQIVASLEQGVRPWIKPWNAEHAAGRITRPLRHNGQPYSGINILALWASAIVQNFAAPIWLTYRQATEEGAQVRQGEKGSLVVFAHSITRTVTSANA